MSEMVERVARALHSKHGYVTEWQDYLEQARTAIAAMREPTQVMIESADTASDKNLMICPTIGWECLTILYRAMIDKALE